MLHDAFGRVLRARNVAEGAQPPHAGHAKTRVWEPEQIRRFVDEVRGDRFYVMWLLGPPRVCARGARRPGARPGRWLPLGFRDWRGCRTMTEDDLHGGDQ